MNNQQIDSSEQPTTMKILNSQNMTYNNNMNNIPEIEEYIPGKRDIKLKFTNPLLSQIKSKPLKTSFLKIVLTFFSYNFPSEEI